jgi:hypothetical protein
VLRSPLSPSRSVLRVSFLGALLASLLVGWLAVPGQARAGTDAAAPRTYTKPYRVSSTVYLSSIATCVVVTLDGAISFSVQSVNSYRMNYVSRKILRPRMTVQTFDQCAGRRKAKRMSQLKAVQEWSSNSCSTSLGISVQYPWGVGIAPTLECGDVRAARSSATYGVGSGFIQNNTNTVVSFSNEGTVYAVRPYCLQRCGDTGWRILDLCLRTEASLVIYGTPTRSESWRPHMMACVRP